MRRSEDRDELAPPEDMTRWHINTCLRTTTAIVELARHDQIPLSEAHCRLLRYGTIISKLIRLAESDGDGEFVIGIPDGADRAVLIRRRTPGRRWWHWRTPRFTLERLLFPAEHHGDQHLIVEGPTPQP